MTRKHGFGLLVALLAAVAAGPSRAYADEAVESSMSPTAVQGQQEQDQLDQQDEQKQQEQQAAQNCASQGGWYDAAAGVCDTSLQK